MSPAHKSARKQSRLLAMTKNHHSQEWWFLVILICAATGNRTLHVQSVLQTLFRLSVFIILQNTS